MIALVLAGCTSSSPSIAGIFLMSLEYYNVAEINSSTNVNRNIPAMFNEVASESSLEVRTGYWGLCVSLDRAPWDCSNDVEKLARTYGPEVDPLSLIGISAKVKESIVFGGLMYVECNIFSHLSLISDS